MSELTVTIVNYRTANSSEKRTAFGVARPSLLGNPFVIGRDGGRDEVIRLYEAWLDERLADSASPQTRMIKELRAILRHEGSITLICWCAPERCHAEVIRDRLLEVVDD